jgi:hypothetical protein
LAESTSLIFGVRVMDTLNEFLRVFPMPRKSAFYDFDLGNRSHVAHAG